MANLLPVLKQLQQERTRLAAQLAQVNQALSALGSGSGGSVRKISPAARRRIAAAQKLRWAKWRRAQKKR